MSLLLLLRGKKKTVAYTSVTSLWGDNTVPYSGDQAVFDYVMKSPPGVSVTSKSIPDYLIDAYQRSLPPKLKKIKDKLDVNPSSYYYGDIESEFVINNEVGVNDYFQTYLDSSVGYTVTLDYVLFNEINNSHATWDIFKRLYGYDSTTNQMDTLSAFIGKPVYLYDAQVKYCSDTIARILDPVLLDGIGIGFNWGETQTRSRNLSAPVTAWVEDVAAVNDHVDMSYTFRVDRTRTKVENLYTSTTISDDMVTDIEPPDPYDSLSTIDLSPNVVDVPTTVEDAPDPLLAPPTSNTAGISEPVLDPLIGHSTGGTLEAGTYYVVITAYNGTGETLASNEESVTLTGSTSFIDGSWAAVVGATGYKFWRGKSTGGQNVHYDVGNVLTYTDTGSSATPTHTETIRTTTWLSYDDYICSVDNDFLFYEESGAIDDSDGLDDASNILDPNISNTFVPSHDGSSSEYFQVRYTYNDGTKDQWGHFTYEYGSGGNLTLDGIYSTGGIVGDFYPKIYCRIDGQRLDTDALKTTDAYKSSMKLCKKLGLNWKDLSTTLHENIGALGDVKQLVLSVSASANSTHSVEQEYLNKWFHKIFTLLDNLPYTTYKERTIRNPITGAPIVLTTSETIPGARLGQTIVMKDTLYEQRLKFGGIRSEVITGSIGVPGTTQHTCVDNDHHYLFQLDEATYREVIVYDLVSYEYVSGGYVTSATATSENLIIPIDNLMFNSMSKRRREELYGRSMRIIVNTTQVIKTKWYQTTAFQVVAFIIAIVIAVVSGGTASGISAAIISAVATTVVVAVVSMVVMKLLIALGVDPTIAAVIATVIALYAGGKVGGGSGLNTAMTAANLMKLTSAAFSAFSAGMQEEFKKTMKAMNDFKDFTKEKIEELEEAKKLLASTGFIYDPLYSPTRGSDRYYMLGESPDMFFARTIATGNIGTGVYDYLANYVDINLQLPSFQSTMNQLNYRAEMA